MLISEVNVDFILLAGYLKLIPMELIRAYPRSIVNIHPSLLPAFGGKGYYGMKVHKAVIASGARYFAAFAVTLFPLFVFLNSVLWLSSSSYLFTILNTEKVSHLFFFFFSLCVWSDTLVQLFILLMNIMTRDEFLPKELSLCSGMTQQRIWLQEFFWR